jgi:hypothetical protein
MRSRASVPIAENMSAKRAISEEWTRVIFPKYWKHRIIVKRRVQDAFCIPEHAAQLSTNLSSSLTGLVLSAGSIAGFLAMGLLADFLGRQPVIWLFYLGALVLSLRVRDLDKMATSYKLRESRSRLTRSLIPTAGSPACATLKEMATCKASRPAVVC